MNTSKQQQRCLNCGELNDSDAEFCVACGQQLPVITEESVTTTQQVMVTASAPESSPFVRLSVASFIIGIFSLALFSWLALLSIDFLQPWISPAVGLPLTCTFFAIAICGLVFGLASLKEGKKVFSILGAVFSCIGIPILAWAIFGFVAFLMMEPHTGYP